MNEHEEIFWSLFSVDMDSVLEEQMRDLVLPSPAPEEILGPYKEDVLSDEPRASTPTTTTQAQAQAVAQAQAGTDAAASVDGASPEDGAKEQPKRTINLESIAPATPKEQSGECWQAFPLFLVLNDYLRLHCTHLLFISISFWLSSTESLSRPSLNFLA